MLDGWRPLAQKYACSLSQLAIAWTIAQPGLTTALCGARKVANAVENAGAGALVLAPEDLARMRKDAETISPLSAV